MTRNLDLWAGIIPAGKDRYASTYTEDYIYIQPDGWIYRWNVNDFLEMNLIVREFDVVAFYGLPIWRIVLWAFKMPITDWLKFVARYAKEERRASARELEDNYDNDLGERSDN